MMMGCGDDDAISENNINKMEKSPSLSISCSICLDFVADNGQRSTAKLLCGHEFHLDCIGSAFNMKGAMQCPNCRKIEEGKWLFANVSARSLAEFGMEEWTFSGEPYEISYSEMPLGVHWCPFSGLTGGLHSLFEEADSPSVTYQELHGNHAIFAEHTGASSLTHSHVAYVRPAPQATSNSSVHIDDQNFSHGQEEINNPRAFSPLNVHHPSWSRQFPPIPISVNRRPVPRSGSSLVSTVHPASNTRDRIQVSRTSHHLPQPGNRNPMMSMRTSRGPGTRRFNGPGGFPLIIPSLPQSDHHHHHHQYHHPHSHGGFFFCPHSRSSGQTPHEAENLLQRGREHPSRFPFTSFDREWSSGDRSGNLWRH